MLQQEGLSKNLETGMIPAHISLM